MIEKGATGKRGEELACQFLRKQGFRVLAQNYRTRLGELDIICRKGKTIIFVEVRSRSEGDGLPAEESLSPRKIDHLLKCAQAWLGEKRLSESTVRFDLVTVDFSGDRPRLSHYPAAFESDFKS
jgi:putative endonuclease